MKALWIGGAIAVAVLYLAYGPEPAPPSRVPTVARTSSVDPCERPYREQALLAQKRMNAELPELEAVKAAGGRMTDTDAWGRWVIASSDEHVILEEMRLRCG